MKLEVEKNSVFDIDLEYAALVYIDEKNVDSETFESLLNIQTPLFIFPYVRNLILQITSSGGYPGVFIDPFDFAGLYFSKKFSSLDKKTME